jgi:hypothetical protein
MLVIELGNIPSPAQPKLELGLGPACLSTFGLWALILTEALPNPRWLKKAKTEAQNSAANFRGNESTLGYLGLSFQITLLGWTWAARSAKNSAR